MTETQTADDAALDELTRAYIAKWQGMGLMPEIAPGEVLVWKRAHRSHHRVFHEHDFEDIPYYHDARRYTEEFQMGVPYCWEDSIVTVNPLRISWYVHERPEKRQGSLLALRVQKDSLRLCPTGLGRGNFFYACEGVPIGGYNVWWFRHHQYQCDLIEGEDAIEWLSDPLVYVEEDYELTSDVKLPAPLEEIVTDDTEVDPRDALGVPLADTPQALQYWQSEGRMPEVSPGKILVWKQVHRLGKFRGRPPEYRSERHRDTHQRFWLDHEYCIPGCAVNADWLEAVSWWSDEDRADQPLLCLAVLADRDSLKYVGYSWDDEEEMDDMFTASRGVPVACYEMAVTEDNDLAMRLVEGQDAREWLP